MSGMTDDDEDHVLANEHVNGGGPISDQDVRALLQQEQAERRRLKAELEQERTQRSRAEASASTHQNARFEAEEHAVAARLAAADGEATDLKRQFAEALAEGRFDESADLQDKMAELRARHHQDRQYAAWLAAEKARATAAPQQPEAVNLADYTPAQRKWIRANPEFMDDPKIRAKTFAGHQLALAEGVEVDSPEYFAIIDETVARARTRTASEDDAGDPVPTQPARREMPSDMPVTRRTPTTQARQQREVRLTADEREAADISMPDVPVDGKHDRDGNWQAGRYERYAQQRQKLRQSGRG